MSYLSELTAHERLTVDNATLDMFTAFENGSDLIYDIWEQYFSDRERKNIESRDLEFIGRILYSVYDRMANAIRDYRCTQAHCRLSSAPPRDGCALVPLLIRAYR